jgi:hypothetical protein
LRGDEDLVVVGDAHQREVFNPASTVGLEGTPQQGYGGALGLQFSLHEGIRPQCVQELSIVDVVAGVLGEKEEYVKQQINVLVAAMLLDCGVVFPVPALKLAKVDDARKQASELSAEIGH